MKILCIGRNYADHAKELKNELPGDPVVFLKPETALMPKGNVFYYPGFTKNLHYETEIVLKIGKPGRHISPAFALSYVTEVGIGIDFTARDLQDQAKQKGLPWEIAKAFDHSAVVSPKFIPIAEIEDLSAIQFSLQLNGQTVQQGNTRDMLFDPTRIITYLSKFFTFKIGDLIFTGTPAGVGPVQVGDKLEAYIGTRKMLAFSVK